MSTNKSNVHRLKNGSVNCSVCFFLFATAGRLEVSSVNAEEPPGSQPVSQCFVKLLCQKRMLFAVSCLKVMMLYCLNYWSNWPGIISYVSLLNVLLKNPGWDCLIILQGDGDILWYNITWLKLCLSDKCQKEISSQICYTASISEFLLMHWWWCML